eukprot:351456-Chlamydomonas_euryale.AAC.2
MDGSHSTPGTPDQHVPLSAPRQYGQMGGRSGQDAALRLRTRCMAHACLWDASMVWCAATLGIRHMCRWRRAGEAFKGALKPHASPQTQCKQQHPNKRPNNNNMQTPTNPNYPPCARAHQPITFWATAHFQKACECQTSAGMRDVCLQTAP